MRCTLVTIWTGIFAMGALSPQLAWAQPTAGRRPAEPLVFVDSRGDTIASDPSNRPYKLIGGYSEYTVGPGDILEVTTWEADTRMTESVRILPTGTVSFSVLHNVHVSGLAVSEVLETLAEALSRYVKSPQVQVRVKQYISGKISVFGSINIAGASLTGERIGPGVYPLKGRVTALDQILEAGGPTPDARLDQVRFMRSNRTYILDLQRAISIGDNSQNVILESGDVIQVAGISQADRRVAVLGEVNIAGVFNLSSEANMLEVIAASRGFTQDAAGNRVRVVRTVDPRNPEIITVNAERILKGDLSQNVGLIDGDIVVVPRDVLTDLNDLLAQIRPLVGFGGIVTTAPVLTVGGWDVNVRGGGATPTATAVTSPAVPTAATQQILEQVQRNLRGGTEAE